MRVPLCVLGEVKAALLTGGSPRSHMTEGNCLERSQCWRIGVGVMGICSLGTFTGSVSPNLGKEEEQKGAREKEGEIRKEQSSHGGEIKIKAKE